MSHRIYHGLHIYTGRRDDLWKNFLRGVLGRQPDDHKSRHQCISGPIEIINFPMPVHAPDARSPALVIENEPRDILHLVFIIIHHLLFG